MSTSSTITAPPQADVDELRSLLDLMADFTDNDQRARYLLSSNWMADHDSRTAVPDHDHISLRVSCCVMAAMDRRSIDTYALAELTGISLNRLTKRLAAVQPFAMSEIWSISQALGVLPHTLLGRDPQS